MTHKYIRVYKNIDISELKDHALVFGDLSGSCSKCKALDLKIDASKCPKCGAEFKYIIFRNIRNHLPKIQKLKESRPDIVMVDHDDFTKMVGAFKAREFLK